MGPGAVAPVSPHSRRPCSLFRELLLCNFPVRFAVLRFLNHEFISAPTLLRSSKSPAEISDTESPMMYTVYSTLYTASQPGQTNSAVACKTSLPMSQKTRPLSHRIQKGQHIDGRDTPPSSLQLWSWHLCRLGAIEYLVYDLCIYNNTTLSHLQNSSLFFYQGSDVISSICRSSLHFIAGCYVAGNLCSAIGNGFTLPDKTSASILHDVQRST